MLVLQLWTTWTAWHSRGASHSTSPSPRSSTTDEGVSRLGNGARRASGGVQGYLRHCTTSCTCGGRSLEGATASTAGSVSCDPPFSPRTDARRPPNAPTGYARWLTAAHWLELEKRRARQTVVNLFCGASEGPRTRWLSQADGSLSPLLVKPFTHCAQFGSWLAVSTGASPAQAVSHPS